LSNDLTGVVYDADRRILRADVDANPPPAIHSSSVHSWAPPPLSWQGRKRLNKGPAYGARSLAGTFSWDANQKPGAIFWQGRSPNSLPHSDFRSPSDSTSAAF
jgi:hypothetical protein